VFDNNKKYCYKYKNCKNNQIMRTLKKVKKTYKRKPSEAFLYAVQKKKFKKMGFKEIPPEYIVELIQKGLTPRYENKRVNTTAEQDGLRFVQGRFQIVFWTSFDTLKKMYTKKYGAFWFSIVDNEDPYKKALYSFKFNRGSSPSRNSERLVGVARMLIEVCLYMQNTLDVKNMDSKKLRSEFRSFFEPFANKPSFSKETAELRAFFMSPFLRDTYVKIIRSRYYFWRQKLKIDGKKKVVTFRHSERKRETMKKTPQFLSVHS